jgi:N-acyl homoserine lactone hydrolase
MPSPVTVLDLGSLTLPAGHPRHADRTSLIQGFVIHHPDGLILVDTGCADDNEFISEMYTPDTVAIVDALNETDIDERDIVAIVNTHLHFDHCGQNRSFPHVPVWLQAAELQAATEQFFTVPEWATMDAERLRKVDGDAVLADGVRILATPGHTPGHQSVLVELAGTRDLIVGQACYTCAEFEAGAVTEEDMHDESWLAAGTASLDRLGALRTDRSFLSHDRAIATHTLR